MSRDLESILSDIASGTAEKAVPALRAYGKQLTPVMKAAATAMTEDDPTRPLVADRVMQLANTVEQSFSPVFASAMDPEMKFNSGSVLLKFGSREPLQWFLAVASTPGPLQYDVIYLLGKLRFPEVRGMILDMLRSMPLIDSPDSWANTDRISGMLSVWKLTGEPLPADVLARLHSPEARREVKAHLKSLGF